jgi:hypothetical protein
MARSSFVDALGVRSLDDSALDYSTGQPVSASPSLWQTTVEKDMPNLRDFIKGAWDNRASEKSYMKILRGAKAKAAT